MKFLSTLITLSILSYGGYWALNHKPELKNQALSYVTTTTTEALEIRHLQAEPATTTYRPLLLMEVKYPHGKITLEKVMLWDMVDGELILDTKSWKRSHGFGDCILAKATASDFQILTLLSKKAHDRESLITNLNLDPYTIDTWIAQAQKKKLIVQNGNYYRLHLSSPNLLVSPHTKTSLPLLPRPISIPHKTPRRFTPSQIKNTCEAAFGADFAVRHMREIYLPVHQTETQTINAFTGKPL